MHGHHFLGSPYACLHRCMSNHEAVGMRMLTREEHLVTKRRHDIETILRGFTNLARTAKGTAVSPRGEQLALCHKQHSVKWGTPNL